jgi:hypothetical protein
VQQFFQMLRHHAELSLVPYGFHDSTRADPLPPLKLVCNNTWKMGVLVERVVRLHNASLDRWLGAAEATVRDAKAKHAASDGTDPHLNAQLREASAALAEAQARVKTPLAASHLRLYEQVSSGHLTQLTANDDATVSDVLPYSAYANKVRKLFYEVLPISRAEILLCLDLKLHHGSLNGALRSPLRICVKKTGTFGDLIDAAAAAVQKARPPTVSGGTLLALPSAAATTTAAAAAGDAPGSPRPGSPRPTTPNAHDGGDALRLSSTITEFVDIDDDTIETDMLFVARVNSDRVAQLIDAKVTFDSPEIHSYWFNNPPATSDFYVAPLSKYEVRLIDAARADGMLAPPACVQVLDTVLDTYLAKVRGMPLFFRFTNLRTTFGDIRARLAARLGVTPEIVYTWKFGAINKGAWLGASQILHFHAATVGPALGSTTSGATASGDDESVRTPGVEPEPPVDPYVAHKDRPILEMLKQDQHLVFMRPSAQVQDKATKTRYYRAPQKSIKIHN